MPPSPADTRFVSGAALTGGTLWLTYGVMDCDARITKVKLSDVLEMLSAREEL